MINLLIFQFIYKCMIFMETLRTNKETYKLFRMYIKICIHYVTHVYAYNTLIYLLDKRHNSPIKFLRQNNLVNNFVGHVKFT